MTIDFITFFRTLCRNRRQKSVLIKQLPISIVIILISVSISYSQSSFSLKDGINLQASDSSVACKIVVSMQPRIEGVWGKNANEDLTLNSYIRRSRLKFNGFMFTPKLTYLIQFGFTNRDMVSNRDPEKDNPGPLFDAMIYWEFMKGTKLVFGQGKLPGNLSRLMSFATLSFPERSYAEKVFTTYRDNGLQIHHESGINNFNWRFYAAMTTGEGRNMESNGNGYCYTGRLELLPLGKFDKKNDRSAFDSNFEKSPKLLLGAAYSLNQDAVWNRATLGTALLYPKDIKSLFADLLFKYNGFSIFGEYYSRTADNILQTNTETGESTYIFAGKGGSAQINYMISNKSNIAFRFGLVEPESKISNKVSKRKDYAIGYSYFLFKNKVKIQSDISMISEKKQGTDKDEWFNARFNVILSL